MLLYGQALANALKPAPQRLLSDVAANPKAEAGLDKGRLG
jgi:hypothetical protein